jgi:hypothetical protein
VLVRVQRIVVDEDADWPLRGEQMSEPIDDLRQRMARWVRNFGCPPGAILRLRQFDGNQG